MEPKAKPKENKAYVCYCNKVDASTIESAIRRGCRTLGRVFDATQAGVGACGGTCRPFIEKMLEQYEKDQTFPANPRPGLGPKSGLKSERRLSNKPKRPR